MGLRGSQRSSKVRDVIAEMETFQHIVEKGFNWGLNVKKKSGRILKLLEKDPLLIEERDKSRKISRGIEGFGSFCLRTSPAEEFPCNSKFNDRTNQEDFSLSPNENDSIKTKTVKPLPKIENLSTENSRAQVDFKANLALGGILLREYTPESKPLLSEQKDYPSRINASTEDHHPFDDTGHITSLSLLSAA